MPDVQYPVIIAFVRGTYQCTRTQRDSDNAGSSVNAVQDAGGCPSDSVNLGVFRASTSG